MTNHSTFSPHDTARENIVTFPHTGDARGYGASAEFDCRGPDGIPEGFTLNNDGIYQLRPGDDDADLVPVKISSPVVVKGRCRTAARHGWGRVVSVQDPEGTWHELVLEGRNLSSSPNVALAPLFDLGLELAPASKAGESVMLLLRSWQPEAVYLRARRLGWTSDAHDAFVLGNGRVIGHALVTTDSVPDDMKAATNTQGTLDAWKSEVAARCVGNPLMMLAVSHAFSGPLLAVLGQTGGGFHLRGKSSRGKSTIQYVASSVWGAPSLLQSWNGTLAHFGGILVRSLAHDAPSYSGVGASGKPGAVQTMRTECARTSVEKRFPGFPLVMAYLPSFWLSGKPGLVQGAFQARMGIQLVHLPGPTQATESNLTDLGRRASLWRDV